MLIDLPGSVGLGASWRATSAFTISADYTRTFWSKGRIRNFFTVDADPGGRRPPPPETFASLPYPTLDDPDQVDTQQVRLGAEYVLIAGRVRFPLRAGFFVDRQYFRAAPRYEGNRGAAPWFQGYTAGTGVSLGPVLWTSRSSHERGAFRSRDDLTLVATRFTRAVRLADLPPGLLTRVFSLQRTGPGRPSWLGWPGSTPVCRTRGSRAARPLREISRVRWGRPSFRRSSMRLYRVLAVLAVAAIPAAADAQVFFADHFDTYANGSTIAGQGGWETWDNAPGADTTVTNAQSFTTPHSLAVSGSGRHRPPVHGRERRRLRHLVRAHPDVRAVDRRPATCSSSC